MSRRAPIFWLTHKGTPPIGDTEIAHPYIQVQLSVNYRKTDALWLETLALVDTGLTFGLIDPQILNTLGATPEGSREISGNLSTNSTDIYSMHWSLSAAPECIVEDKSNAIEHALPFSGAKAIVGMSLLQFGTLHLRGRHSDSFFEFHKP
ncbi:hypothetical protein [Pseudochrobactrum saccharolyticum]|uniref:hypothetical protein n=1 Tax=Pseudochrobactrum saccharolyticum TaxID=354352 RepID=UPI002769782F|nr:hypothetical protein [Pseudochrobactrum saccharolyticum]MDP8249626.1 hypothetical protein [Pseudochrobactrum saccharolyticum]